MGACYDVRVKMRFNDKKSAQEKAVAALQAYITEHDGKGILFSLDKFEKDGITPDFLEGLLRIFLCGSNYWHPEIKYGQENRRIFVWQRDVHHDYHCDLPCNYTHDLQICC